MTYALIAFTIVQLATVLLAYSFGMAWILQRDLQRKNADDLQKLLVVVESRVDDLLDRHYQFSSNHAGHLNKLDKLVARAEGVGLEAVSALGAHQKTDHGSSDAADKHRAELDKVIKLLAEDWRERFFQLEGDWKKLKEHQESQLAGTLAQVSSLNTRGFNR